jgi:hypothetical protein
MEMAFTWILMTDRCFLSFNHGFIITINHLKNKLNSKTYTMAMTRGQMFGKARLIKKFPREWSIAFNLILCTHKRAAQTQQTGRILRSSLFGDQHVYLQSPRSYVAWCRATFIFQIDTDSQIKYFCIKQNSLDMITLVSVCIRMSLASCTWNIFNSTILLY